MTRLQAIGAAVGLIALLIYSSVYVVNARDQAIVMRFGRIIDVKTAPGIYFKLPFGMFDADSVQLVENRTMRFDLDNIRGQVSGGKFYDVDAFVAYRISDARRFREQAQGSLQNAETLVKTQLDAALRRVYGERDFEAALSEERGNMMREVKGQIAPAATALGLTVDDVRIRRTDLTTEVSQQTYERMKAERLAEAERLRARGRERAQGTKARADREVVETIAAAQREAEIVRGQGEAERNGIFAGAFGRDPEFFEFYRSMNAYLQALDGSGTTMLLSPDSEFFRYFKDAGGRPLQPGAAPTSAIPAPVQQGLVQPAPAPAPAN